MLDRGASPSHARTGVHALGTIFLKIILQYLIMGVVLLTSAGTFFWSRAWVYVGLGVLCFALNALVVSHNNPQMIVERHRKRGDTKAADKILTSSITIATIAMWIAAGIDAVRFGRFVLSPVALATGTAFHLAGMAIIGWAMVTNPFLEKSVRIQSDRGQEVVSTGPYGIVRHPMYFAMILIGIACPLILGSAWACVPLALYILLFILRTHFEDKTLRRELHGYQAYTLVTCYRLVPLVW